MSEKNIGKKILLVSQSLSVTGAPYVLFWLAKFLRLKGYDIDVWSLRSGELIKDFQENGFELKLIPNNKREILKLYKKNHKKYDLIICNTVETYKCVDVLQRVKTPLIWYVHETKFLDDYIIEHPDFAELFKSFYNVYTVSEYAKSVVLKYNQNVKVIPNGIEDRFTNFSPVLDHVRFGFIGSLIEVKGIDLLVHAFMNILSKYPDATLDVAGNFETSLAENLRAETKGIANIRWLGIVQDKAKQDFFDNIDVLCVPSLDDPCPLTVLEGAMRGKALITTDKAGSNYVIKSPKDSFVVPANEVQPLTEAMSSICQHIDCLPQMQKSMRENYLELAHIHVQEQAIIKMLEENVENYPIVKTKLKLEKPKIIYKIKGENGKRTVCFMGLKLFSYIKKGDKK